MNGPYFQEVIHFQADFHEEAKLGWIFYEERQMWLVLGKRGAQVTWETIRFSHTLALLFSSR